MKYQKLFAVFVVSFALLFTVQPANAEAFRPNISQTFFADKFYRTELYFGLNKKGGGTVSGEEWDDFLEKEVTSRFPDGFTVFDAYGQYKDSTGKIVREKSRVLVIFYPKKLRREVDPKIEELRTAYKKRFDQESVLRLDFRRTVAVSF